MTAIIVHKNGKIEEIKDIVEIDPQPDRVGILREKSFCFFYFHEIKSIKFYNYPVVYIP